MPSEAPLSTHRADLLARLSEPVQYDLAVVGGGATGLGVALDAASRGHRVVLLESHDFASGTSSRSTKLVHGGVRYLAQGHWPLVREALHERATLLRNAPHLVHPLPFVMPCYQWWEKPFYGLGLKLYDALAGHTSDALGLGDTELLDARQTLVCLPTARASGLRGGVKYWDGQFDDARLALALARTAARHGALLVNHCPVTKLMHDGGKVVGLVCQDGESGREFALQARCVVNATGVWVDALRQQDGATVRQTGTVPAMVSPSQGVHLVVDRSFLPGDHALLVPKTTDGRVLFVLPWLGKTLLGTTDTPRTDLPREPQPFQHEIDFILREAGRCLSRSPTRADVTSTWVGLRPLVRPADSSDGHGVPSATRSLSREHAIRIGHSGLVTVTGGKWTTYRSMAEDVLAHCTDAGLLEERGDAVTAHLLLVGSDDEPVNGGCDLAGFAEGMVRFAISHEYARSVEDVLARRSRLLFLDAAQTKRVAPAVSRVLLQETGSDGNLAGFLRLADQYAQSTKVSGPLF